MHADKRCLSIEMQSISKLTDYIGGIVLDYLLPILFFAGIGIIAGIVLTIAGRLFAVVVDDSVEKVTEQFPGLNCGACGFASCERYAVAIVKENVPANQCKPGGIETAEKVAAVLGKEVAEVQHDVAFVRCAGSCSRKYKYRGTQSCRASELYYNGKEVCRFGCSGLGDCVEVCPTGAITIGNNRRAVVAFGRCNACGLCIKACPKKIISIQKASQAVHVACCSVDTGKITKSSCAHGCIGCKICEKKCSQQAIKVKENIARINPDLCNNCGECAQLCPVGCILFIKECEGL
jgi:Na+-translocating ferredoxin:NAD+ oxidoreductase RNF subunit RnfB